MWGVDDALTVTGLAKSYGERRAADGVTFSAAAGRITAVLGPNGSGKTTLLSILGFIMQPTSGKLTIAGQSVIGLSAE